MKKYTVLLVMIICLLFPACTMLESGDPETTAPDSSSTAGDIDEPDDAENTGDIEGTVKGVMKSDTPANSAVKKEKIALALYYQDRDGYIIPVTRRLDKQEGIAKAALFWLIDSAANREELQYFGIYPILPEGTEILGMTIKEGTATVDFNEKLLSYEDQKAENNIISSIVYMLTEFKTISNVRILINGYSREKLKYDTDISGLLDRSNVLINTSRVNLGQGKDKLDIYVLRNANDEFSYILPISVELDDMMEEDVPKRIVELFSSDFEGNGFYSEVPREAGLIDSKVSGDLLVLNFNSHIRDYGGNARENFIINQILFSMKQINGVNKVKIIVDGKDTLMPEGSEVSIEMKLPTVINDVIDG